MSPEPVQLTINSERLALRILIFCILAEIVFVFLDYHINYGEWTYIGAMRRMFNTAREDGLASWFAMTQTLLASLTLGLIYLSLKNGPGPRWKSWGWLVLSIFFFYMAIDDGAQLHERFGSTFKEALWNATGATLNFFPSYAWQILFLPFFGALGLFMFGFLWYELGSRSSRLLLMTAVFLQVVAVAMDFVEGLEAEHRWNLYTIIANRYDLEPWTQARFGETAFDALRHFSKSFEEAIEMASISILWFLFLRHLSNAAGDLRVRFVREEVS